MENATYINSIKVILTSSEFYGKKPLSIAAIIQVLRKYDRDQLSIIFSKWMVMMRRKGANEEAVQIMLAKNLLNRSQYKRLRNHHTKSNRRIILTEDVVLALIKLNLTHNQLGGMQLENVGDAKSLFKVITSLNEDYVSNQLISYSDNAAADVNHYENLRFAMAKQYLGINPEEIVYQMYRGKTITESMVQISADFNDIFENQMGMSINQFQEIIFLLLIDWGIPVERKTIEEIVFKKHEVYFEKLSISQDKINKVVDYLSVTPDKFVETNEQILSGAGLQDDTHNLAIFFTKPILKLEPGLLCISPNSLAMQLTNAPYNIVRDALKATNNSNRINQLPIDWGAAYEEYIISVLRTTFNQELMTNIISTRTGQASVDAVISFNDVIFPVEIKYPHWKFSSRQNPTREALTGHIQKFVSRNKGLGQIKKFLEQTQNGEIENGISLEGKIIVPVVVLGEAYPFDPLSRDLIEEVARENRLLPEGDFVLPFIILSTNEIELLQGITETYGMGHAKSALVAYSYMIQETKDAGYAYRPTTFWNLYTTNNVPVGHGSDMKRHLDVFTDGILARYKMARK